MAEILVKLMSKNSYLNLYVSVSVGIAYVVIVLPPPIIKERERGFAVSRIPEE